MYALRDFEEQVADPSFSVRQLAAHEHDRDTAVLSVQGDIDLGTAPLLREALLAVVDHESRSVLVDLCEVAFMDSTGVHVLLDAVRRLESQDRQLAIACRDDGQVHRILDLVGLLDAVAVYPAGGEGLRPHRAAGRPRRYFGNNRPQPRSLPATPTPQGG